MLRIDGVSVSYPGRVLAADLSAAFRPGEIWAVLGRNGSGKSTLLHALAGLRRPEAGTVVLDGMRMDDVPRRMVASRVGVLLQEENREFWGSVRDYVLLGRYPHARNPFGWTAEDEKIAGDELRNVHLDAFADRPFATLSGGERQRARVAALMAQRPAAYLLDEPLQHLDLPHQVALLERLAAEARAREATVVMVLHDLVFASRYCDHCLLLFGDGRYHVDTTARALTEERLGALYGHPLQPVDVGGERLFLPKRGPGQGAHV